MKTHVALRRAQTELAENYTRLRELEQLRDDLVHMIVHDMRSPLRRCASPPAPESMRPHARRRRPEDLRAAIGSAALSRMTNDLLDVSRLEEGRMPVERAVCDLTRMADDVRAALGGHGRDRRIDDRERGAGRGDCDGGLVRRVIENLVSNGIKHTPAGSRVRIPWPARRPRARRGARRGPWRAAGSQGEDLREVRTRRDAARTDLSLGRAGPGVLQARRRGARRCHRRGSAVADGSTFWFELPA